MAQLGFRNETASGTELSGISYRYVGALGHLKIEVVNLDTPTAGDYFYSLLVNPVGVMCGATTDATATDTTVQCTLSGKTVTVGAGFSGTPSIGVIVFGF
jgi:hypothetical protein